MKIYSLDNSGSEQKWYNLKKKHFFMALLGNGQFESYKFKIENHEWATKKKQI